MFKNIKNDSPLSARPGSSSSPAGPGVASVGVAPQESSWIGLLSRPALSFLQSLVPVRLRTLPLTDIGTGWFGGEYRNSFIPEDSEFLNHLDDFKQAAPHLSYLQCEQAAVPVPEPQHSSRTGGTDAFQRWYTTNSLLLTQDLKGFSGGELVKTKPWLDSSQTGLLSKMCEGGTVPGTFYPETTAVFVHGGWTLGENSGPPLHTQAPKECPPPDQNTEVSPAPERSDLDSVEEDHPQRTGTHHLDRSPSEEPQQDASAPAISVADKTEEEEVPRCQNKAIAFIMGCPCSDDSQSECSDNDDDGFNSEGSSDLTLSSEEDEEESEDEEEEEVDVDSERLWSSLCRSVDPYNPRNFTASQHTGGAPAAMPLSSTQSSPGAYSLSSSQDSWDDSSSSSEVDEESVSLWSSFNCSSDPYSPLNFTAPLRTQRPAATMSPPDYRREEAEERLDSGFSELLTSSSSPPTSKQTCRKTKKVRFCDQVEEFFASCGEEEEDRRGPWEELARDRCRFLRRCQEVEQSISFCLQPQHRRQVFQRLTVQHVHNT